MSMVGIGEDFGQELLDQHRRYAQRSRRLRERFASGDLFEMTAEQRGRHSGARVEVEGYASVRKASGGYTDEIVVREARGRGVGL
jgi:hypothetical protein